MRSLVGLLLFLVFVDDKECNYKKHLGAPMGWVNTLIEPTVIKIRPFDLIMLVVLLVASSQSKGKGASTAPMKNALFVMLGTTVLWFVYGVARGGDSRMASWQTYLIFSMVLVTFAVAATFRTPEHFGGLAKWLLAAGMYRAVMCWLSYFTWARAMVGESGAFLTDHEDTITWIASILVLIVNAVDRRTALTTVRNLAGIAFLLGAIQWNSRRVAWVSLAMALAVMYVLFPKGAAKRRVVRAAKIAAPLLVVYVVVGWGRHNPIFIPLRSISSVSTQEDASTKARNAENLGLIATSHFAGVVTGTGWGHPYAAISVKYSIAWIELWKYEPHNSILGLLAFTGMLGFAGIWLPMPTAVFFNARLARLGSDPKARAAGIVGASQMIVCANQFYGDIGIFSIQAMYVIAVSYAMALSLPSRAGVWNAPAKGAGRNS